MSKKTFAAGALVLAVVVAGGGLFASNMGFKLNYELTGPGGSSLNGTNSLSLPYIQQVGLVNASDLVNDIGSSVVTNVQKLNENNNTLQVYPVDPDFALTPGEGYFVRVSTTQNYIVVGAHDPSWSVPLDGPGAGSLNGTNFYAYPYHSTASTASGLAAEIGSALVTNVQKLNKLNNTLQVWPVDPDFSLAPGESYFVRMNTTVNFVPPHY